MLCYKTGIEESGLCHEQAYCCHLNVSFSVKCFIILLFFNVLLYIIKYDLMIYLNCLKCSLNIIWVFLGSFFCVG